LLETGQRREGDGAVPALVDVLHQAARDDQVGALMAGDGRLLAGLGQGQLGVLVLVFRAAMTAPPARRALVLPVLVFVPVLSPFGHPACRRECVFPMVPFGRFPWISSRCTGPATTSCSSTVGAGSRPIGRSSRGACRTAISA